MTTTALEGVGRVARAVKSFERPLRIEGHSDSVPISTREFRSNWKLSTVTESLIRVLRTIPPTTAHATVGWTS